MKKTPAKGHTRKHTGTSKHTATKKHSPSATKKTATAAGHSVHTVAKHPAHAKARGLALGEGVTCCSAEALAASLRLAGAAVHDDDVLALHWRAGGDADAGVSILAALEVAAEFGLAGYRPVSYGPLGAVAGGDSNSQTMPLSATAGAPRQRSSLLGLELPGPHVVLAEGGGWWSWGRPWDVSAFPHAVIEEAWAVTWA